LQEIKEENLIPLVERISFELRNYYTKANESLIKDFIMKLFMKNMVHFDLPNTEFMNFFLNENNKVLIQKSFEKAFENRGIKKPVFEEFRKIVEFDLKNLKTFTSQRENLEKS